jgi:hypothetical protein
MFATNRTRMVTSPMIAARLSAYCTFSIKTFWIFHFCISFICLTIEFSGIEAALAAKAERK